MIHAFLNRTILFQFYKKKKKTKKIFQDGKF